MNLFEKTITFTCFQKMFPVKNVQDLQKLNDAISLQNQVQEDRLQHKLGKQNYHESAKKLFKLMTDAIKDSSKNKAKTLKENSINNNKAIENLNKKNLELMNDKGIIAPTLASSLVNLFKPENKSQFRLKKDLTSTRMNDVLINGGIPVSIHDNMLTFRDSNRSFKLDGDLSETITNYDFNVDLFIQQDRKLI